MVFARWGAPVRTLVLFFSKSFSPLRRAFLKAFGVAEVLSLLARRFGVAR